jgi:hypothetical protein
MGYKRRVCLVCAKEYQATTSGQKYCPECRVIGKRAHDKIYFAVHREERNVRNAGYYAADPERKKRTTTAWRNANPDKVASITHRGHFKRRTLGFIPLNSWFPGCEAHHINNDDVIHLPRTLHRSIWHNQRTGQGMVQMNALARQYLAEDGR